MSMSSVDALLAQRNQSWGGKIQRSFNKEVTVKATGEVRNLREVWIRCNPTDHQYEVSKQDMETKDISTDIDTYRIAIWEGDPGYETACKTVPGGSIKLHSGPVVVSEEGYVNTHVVKFMYCPDPQANYFKMPKLSARL